MLLKNKKDNIYYYKCSCGNTFKSKFDNKVCFNCIKIYKNIKNKKDVIDIVKKLDLIVNNLLIKGIQNE